MRKRILIFVAVVATLLLVPIVLTAVLLYTESGTRLIAAQLPRLERFGVRIENLSGTIAGGLRIARVELVHPRVHIVSHDIIVQIEASRLIFQTVRVSSLTARDTLVEIRAAQMPPSTRPPRFLPSFVRIDARSIDFTRVRYVNINGYTVDAERVASRGRMSSQTIAVRDIRVTGPLFDATAELDLRAARPLGLSGKVSGRVHAESSPEIALEGQVSGNLDRLGIKATVRTPSVASIDATYTHPNDRWRIDGRIVSPSFVFDPWLPRPPFSLRDVALHVEATDQQIRAAGTLGVPELDNADLTIDARGRYSARELRIAAADLALNGTPARLHAVGLATFDGGPPTLDVDANWSNLQWPLACASRGHERERKSTAARTVALRLRSRRCSRRTAGTCGAGHGNRYALKGQRGVQHLFHCSTAGILYGRGHPHLRPTARMDTEYARDRCRSRGSAP